MNLIRSSLSIGNLLGRRSRQVAATWSRRALCTKPQEPKPQHPPAPAPRAGFRLPGYKPSEMDKKILIWSGRFKTVDQIPELVSFEMLDSARNKIRVKACYVMIALTIAACIVMVILGKQAAGRNESLTNQNMEKKAKWRAEAERERQAKMAEMSEKTQ